MLQETERQHDNVEIMFQDESRFGTLTTLGRAWKPKGVDYEVKTKMGRENLYVFGAVSPSTGELFTQDYEKSNTEGMNDFLKKLSERKPEKHLLLVLDRAGWHTTGKLECPANVTLLFLPPTSPQLNPIERLWKYLKNNFFHNLIHDHIEDVKTSIAKGLASLNQTAIASLCACDYITP